MNLHLASVKSLIEAISEKNGISMAFFERALELPVRTVTRWKNGDFSATAIALLRTIKTYPWIAEVAANRFEPHVARKILLRESFALINDAVSASEGSSIQFYVEQDQSTVSATAVLSAKRPMQPKLVAIGG